MREKTARLGLAEIRPDAELVKVRVTIDERVDDFVRRMEYRHRVSKSSVIETALLLLMKRDDDAVGDLLREAKAGLRRR